jgi:eukaryotic-like serine/threonine-protein kinase
MKSPASMGGNSVGRSSNSDHSIGDNSINDNSINRVAHYNLLERLEPAGPGELYRARDTHRGRTVVIRLLSASDGTSTAALLEQARAFTAVSHPNVITVFDAGEHEGRPYLAFEYVRGQSLRAEMAGRPMNVRRAVELAIQICDAVAEGHALGFVHGGLSPEAIGITAKGHAKIPAFELATTSGFERLDGVSKLRDYESPEEARGERGDDRSDIYSVGALLYEMLTTRRPMHRGAAAPGAANPNVPNELDHVVLKAVAPNPDLRYQSAAALSGELRSVNAILDARGGTDDEEEQVPASSGLGRIIVTTIVILAGLGAVAWWLMRP